jgi:predicted dehydrogenase
MLASAAVAAIPVGPSIFLPGAALQPGSVRPSGAPLRVGVVGVRGRGRAHVGAFKKSAHSEVVAICDADEGVIEGAMKAVPSARYYKDIRKMLEDKSIDIVSIATPNHWHSLATIWALEAGKHVYVEKPISHNIHEGRRVVQTTGKTGLIVQHGTQARSMPATAEALQWMNEGGLGKVLVARALCYKNRGSIGKVAGPQEPPATMDYDLWTGPAEMQPLMRKSVHYDWHWVFNTGNGDIGNQGVHQMDIARWGLAKNELPERVVSCGGRLGYVDDANTPNTMVTLLDYGDQKLIFEVRGLRTPGYRKTKIGVLFHCENGYLACSSYGKVHAFDHDGEIVKTFKGGNSHFENFLAAVKTNDAKHLNADATQGHLSAALCHLGNISYQVGKPAKFGATEEPFGNQTAANDSFARFAAHLAVNGVDIQSENYTMGPSLQFDTETERFVGPHSSEANKLVTRPYRGPFKV